MQSQAVTLILVPTWPIGSKAAQQIDLLDPSIFCTLRFSHPAIHIADSGGINTHTAKNVCRLCTKKYHFQVTGCFHPRVAGDEITLPFF
jgi:hypothetical protein